MSPKRRIDEERLIEAAVAEFSVHSFSDASINTIIAAAGISKGSFYYRFATKYDLYVHVLKTGVRRKWDYIRETLEGPEYSGSTSAAGSDLFDTFLLQARAGTAFARAHPEFHGLSVMFSREKGTRVYEDALRDLGQGEGTGLEETVRAARARGEIRSDLSEDLVVRVLSHLLMSFDEILFGRDEWSLEAANERLEEYVRFLRHGLAAPQP